jgi:NADPH-dependent FMN reductase
MLKIAIIIGSTRPGRNGEAVAKWVYKNAQKRNDAEFELVEHQRTRSKTNTSAFLVRIFGDSRGKPTRRKGGGNRMTRLRKEPSAAIRGLPKQQLTPCQIREELVKGNGNFCIRGCSPLRQKQQALGRFHGKGMNYVNA